MGRLIHVDLETYSPLDLRKVGAWRYSCHPEARIVVTAYAIDDGDVIIGELPKLERDDKLIAYNAEFEFMCLKNIAGLDIHTDQMICVMALAGTIGFSTSLDKVSQLLELGVEKDRRGKFLIAKLIKTGELIPSEMKDFEEYCAQDVEVSRAVYNKIRSFNTWSEREIEVYQDTLTMNVKGFPVNMRLIELCVERKKWAEVRIKKIFKGLTAQLIAEENMQDEKVNFAREWLESRPEAKLRSVEIRNKIITDWEGGISHTRKGKLKEMLGIGSLDKKYWPDYKFTGIRHDIFEMYKSISFSAVAKIDTAANFVNPDGRIRGCLTYHGAHSGRWAGRGYQLQNMPRKTIGSSDEEIIANVKVMRDSEDPIEVWNLLAGIPRHFLFTSKGFCVFDYKSIELYTSFAMAGIDHKGLDGYKSFASILFNKPYADITKQERNIAKPIVLGCQYQMSGKTLRQSAKDMYNLDFDLEIATEYVTKFRAIYPEIVAKWQELENNARRAVMGRTIVGAFDGTNSECLVYKLPSGRTVGFYRPRVVNFRITYMNKFGLDESLYGGKIYNFANQGTGRDILAYAMHKFTDVAVASIHDEVIIEDKENFDRVKSIMEEPVEWMPNVYLEAEGETGNFYRKF